MSNEFIEKEKKREWDHKKDKLHELPYPEILKSGTIRLATGHPNEWELFAVSNEMIDGCTVTVTCEEYDTEGVHSDTL